MERPHRVTWEAERGIRGEIYCNHPFAFSHLTINRRITFLLSINIWHGSRFYEKMTFLFYFHLRKQREIWHYGRYELSRHAEHIEPSCCLLFVSLCLLAIRGYVKLNGKQTTPTCPPSSGQFAFTSSLFSSHRLILSMEKVKSYIWFHNCFWSWKVLKVKEM